MTTFSGLFRNLTPNEVKEFQDYAIRNDPPDLKEWDIYHPVCREVWCKRGKCPHPAHGGKL